jgi:hypothetical protein
MCWHLVRRVWRHRLNVPAPSPQHAVEGNSPLLGYHEALPITRLQSIRGKVRMRRGSPLRSTPVRRRARWLTRGRLNMLA